MFFVNRPQSCDSWGNLYAPFIALLRAALWNEPLPDLELDVQAWLDLYKEARRHKIQGVLYPVVADLPTVPHALLSKWSEEAGRIRARNQHLSRVADKQSASWTRRGIDAVELKGRTVAAFYPEPLLRVCGDIDWWFPTDDDFFASLIAARENGCYLEMDSDGDYHYLLGNVVVEHHRHGLEAEGALGQILLLNTHLLHHAMGAGIGLRHLCDLALALERMDGCYDREEYLGLLSARHLALWNSVVEEAIALLKTCGGFGQRGAAGDGCIRPRRLAEMFMQSVMTDGEFGLGRRRRFAGMFRRASFFLRVAPGPFLKHWFHLVIGRLKR